MSNLIFFTDLDGTLLNKEGEITITTRNAIEKFIRRGNKFVICTGRPLLNALLIFNSIRIPNVNCYIVATNGTQIYDCKAGKTIYRSTIDIDDVIEIFQIADKYGINCLAYGDSHIVCKENNEVINLYAKKMIIDVLASNNIAEVLPNSTGCLMAIEYNDWDKMEAFQKEVNEKFIKKIIAVKSNVNYVDIFNANAGKGNSVRILCDLLGIPVENSIAAGDEKNDLSLIHEAGIGIAMCNGCDAVKNAADIVTKNDNNHDGLAPYFDSF